MRTLLLEALALLVYPGLLTAAAVGLLGEWALRRLAGRPARLTALLRGLLVRPPATAVAAAVAGALAAAQLGAPFSPLDPIDRNVLIAIACGCAVVWLGWAAAAREPGTSVAVGAGGWALSVLSLAVLAQDLHPQVLAGLALTAAIPAKLAAALLYLLSLPLVLGAADRPSAHRLWLWLPAGGLFASVFLPAAANDLLGVLRFFGTGALVIAAAAALGPRLASRRLYPGAVAVLAVVAPSLAATASFFR